MLGLQLSAAAPVAGILVPDLDRRRSTAIAVTLRPDEIRRVLFRYLYLPFDPKFPDDLLLLRRRSEWEIQEAGRQIAEQLCELPAVRYRFAGASPSAGESLAQLIDVLDMQR